jgi:hypothetical protein
VLADLTPEFGQRSGDSGAVEPGLLSSINCRQAVHEHEPAGSEGARASEAVGGGEAVERARAHV